MCMFYMKINSRSHILMYMFLMRDDKEERKKLARSNKAKQHSTCMGR